MGNIFIIASLCLFLASCSYISMDSKMDGKAGAKDDQQEVSGQSKAWQNDDMKQKDAEKKVDDKKEDQKQVQKQK